MSRVSQRPRNSSIVFRAGVVLGLLVIVAAALAWRGFEASRRDAERRAIDEAITAGRFEEASRRIEGWDARGRIEPSGDYWRARLALARGDLMAAAESTRMAIARGVDDPEQLEVLRAILRGPSQADTGSILTLYRAFVERIEPRREVLRVLSQAYLELFQLAAADVVLDAWVAEFPDDVLAHKNRLEVLKRVDSDVEDVLVTHRRVLEIDPNDLSIRLSLAQILNEAEDPRAAKVHLDRYLQQSRENPEALVLAGLNAVQLGDLDTAEQRFRKACTIDPDHAEAWDQLGALAQHRGAIAEACDLFARSVEADPYRPGPRYRYHLALIANGRPEDAERQWEQYKRLQGEMARMDQLRRALAHGPNNLEVQVGIARWQIEHGQIEQGLRWAEKVLRNAPDHVEVLELLERHYRSTGDDGKANYYLDRLQTAAS